MRVQWLLAVSLVLSACTPFRLSTRGGTFTEGVVELGCEESARIEVFEPTTVTGLSVLTANGDTTTASCLASGRYFVVARGRGGSLSAQRTGLSPQTVWVASRCTAPPLISTDGSTFIALPAHVEQTAKGTECIFWLAQVPRPSMGWVKHGDQSQPEPWDPSDSPQIRVSKNESATFCLDSLCGPEALSTATCK